MSKRMGLPVTLKMRHDAHYVESLTSYSGAAVGRMIPVDQIRPNPDQPRKALGDLRELMFEHLQRLSMASHSKMETGAILSHFSSDLIAIENAMGMAIPWGILPGMEAVASTVLLIALDWRLAHRLVARMTTKSCSR